MNEQAPNILFLIADHHRWDWLDCAGYNIPIRTPNIDRLAAQGMLFEQCICQSPLCAPSRASLATGLYPHRIGVPNNKHNLDPSLTTYMQLLRNDGYRVATCGKCDLHKKTKWYGLEGWTRRLGRLGYTEAIDQAGKIDAALLSGWPKPSDPYMAYLHEQGLAETHHRDYIKRRKHNGVAAWPAPFARQHYTDDFAGRAALDLLDGFPLDQPWYLQVNFPGPHGPYDAPAELLQRYDGVEFDMPIAANPEETTDHLAVRRNFAAMIEGIDEWVGRIVDAVAMRGELENTVVVYTSDHGEMLGEQGRWGKNVPFEPSIHVPLIVAGPGVEKNVRNDALVELSDLSATFLTFAHLQPPAKWDAQSLAPLLLGERTAHRDVQISMLDNWQLVRDRRWKLVVTDGKPFHLFDLVADPHELDNRVHMVENQSTLEKLQNALTHHISAADGTDSGDYQLGKKQRHVSAKRDLKTDGVSSKKK